MEWAFPKHADGRFDPNGIDILFGLVSGSNGGRRVSGTRFSSTKPQTEVSTFDVLGVPLSSPDRRFVGFTSTNARVVASLQEHLEQVAQQSLSLVPVAARDVGLTYTSPLPVWGGGERRSG